MKTGLTICILHNNISLQRIIPLPDNIIYKKMLACLENGYLAIHISKNEVADKHEKKVLFKLRVNIIHTKPQLVTGAYVISHAFLY